MNFTQLDYLLFRIKYYGGESRADLGKTTQTFAENNTLGTNPLLQHFQAEWTRLWKTSALAENNYKCWIKI